MGKPAAVRFVPALPWLQPPTSAVRRRPAFPLDQARLRLTFSGTAALAQGIRLAGIGSGDQVLCPRYHCGHELEPFRRAGAALSFYRIGADLQLDLEDLQRQLETRPRAVLITHYFGLPQRALSTVRAACHRAGALLIEDCAHALFSQDENGPLGSTGDLSIFSFRKSLPLPHGGGLLVNTPDLPLPTAGVPPPALSTATKALELYQKSLLQNTQGRHGRLERAAWPLCLVALQAAGIAWRLKLPSRLAWYDPDDEDLGFDDRILGWGMSRYSQRLLSALADPTIRDTRRRHWQQLAEGLQDCPGVTPVVASLPELACPLYFPVLCTQRDDTVRALRAAQLYAAPWWEEPYTRVPMPPCAVTDRLRQQLIALPLHQDLETPALERLLHFFHHR